MLLKPYGVASDPTRKLKKKSNATNKRAAGAAPAPEATPVPPAKKKRGAKTKKN